MVIEPNFEEGLLDDLGRSRRFVQAGIDEEIPIKKSKNSNKNKNKISGHLKHSKQKNTTSEYRPLSTAQQIRIAAGFQQAILKITSYGKGIDKVLGHLVYISRDFNLPLEDQDQSLLHSSEDVNALLSSWKDIYFDKKSHARDTVHMVLSAPPGTCRHTFKGVVREFLSEQYEGEHDYLFVPHDDTEHPHVHAVICLRSIEGPKLDPRKKYLNGLRKKFAEKCREQGIMLDASRRFERGLAGKPLKSELVQMREKRNLMPEADKRLIAKVKTELTSEYSSLDTGEALRKSRNQNIKKQFYNTAKKLYEAYMASPKEAKDNKDIMAAKMLFDYSKTISNEMTRADFLKEHLLKNPSPVLEKPHGFIEAGWPSNLKAPKPDLDL